MDSSNNKNALHRYTLKVLAILTGIITIYYVITTAFPMLIPTEAVYGSYYFPRMYWVFPHIVLGIIATIIGPFQFMPKIRNKYLKIHRQLGRVYMMSTVLSGISGMYMAVTSDVNLPYAVGLFMLGVAWSTSSIMAFISIKNRKIDLHKEWMIRSYVITLAFVTFRFVYDIIRSFDIGTWEEVQVLMSWACWAIPLFIAEVFIQGKKIKKK
ncbi:DUF2306 domain-containing protein [Winogradskyella psychrotolerans]|uniref:DUF2306 domain-containing protein n=1 Tax=Winogradskyella psychrotolerans TaxID=1344585 RepID=UPI001C06E807|nr:DUF2306 domain-containing protein [Winogradskyella psychrotolerans]MBU2922922.1 DUF2306 domain-containing protein [Winogradskyella psychrotolerans]